MYLQLMYLSCIIHTILPLNITDYLYRYGYLDLSETSITNLETALIKFQEFYGLPVDGTLNNETIDLMNNPRCDVSDNPTEYYTNTHKWIKKQLFWYFALADVTTQKVADRVFEMWQNYTNLNFTYSVKNPDILISFSDKIFLHKNNPRCMKGQCSMAFDGKSGALAHAYPPHQNKCVEIHLDKSEDWYFGFNKTPPTQTSLFKVLLHEVGHTLGIKHSSDSTSIMYAYYSENNNHLSNDDIEAVQYLYGKKQQQESSVNITNITSTTPITIATSEIGKTMEIKLDLCETWSNKFLITSNHHMYVFYEEWVWIINIAEQRYYTKPIKLSYYLPPQLIPITHIYQNIYDDVVILDSDSNIFYKIGFPDFTMKHRFPASKFNIPTEAKINSVFNTHSGRTYIFYDNYYFVEIDECTSTTKTRGIITEKFPGIPLNVNGAFRYKNGNIFFFLNQTVYEFNEFSNKVVNVGQFNLDMIELQCISKSTLVQKIQKLLSQLLTIQR